MVDPVSVVAVAALGGVLGAALGGYLALGALGCLVVVGQLLAVFEVALPAAVPASLGYTVWFGPHTLLGGGVAAAAFAVRRGYMDESYRYHPAKDVTTPLVDQPKALAVGGVFGVFGAGVAWAYGTVGAPFDPVAAAVVLSAFVHRVALGYPLVGDARGHVLDMSPYERGERREAMTDGGRAVGQSATHRGVDTDRPASTTRFVVEPFAPWQTDWRTAAALGGGVGLVSAALAAVTGSATLPFGLAAAALLGFAVREEVPVVYHVALAAGLTVLAVGPAEGAGLDVGAALPSVLAAGTVAGLVVALLAELLQRVFYAHAETHFDAPFAAVFLYSVALGVLALVGVVGTPL